MAFQARHQLVSLEETSASRYVVPEEKGSCSLGISSRRYTQVSPLEGEAFCAAPMELEPFPDPLL